jgi:hypothetical protein
VPFRERYRSSPNVHRGYAGLPGKVTAARRSRTGQKSSSEAEFAQTWPADTGPAPTSTSASDNRLAGSARRLVIEATFGI